MKSGCGWVGLFACNLPGTYFNTAVLLFLILCVRVCFFFFFLPWRDLAASTDCLPLVVVTVVGDVTVDVSF